MSNGISAQHPAVVLRTTYQHLRALLALATVVIVGLTGAVVVLAINSGASTNVSPAASTAIRATPAATVGPNPDQRGVQRSAPPVGLINNYTGHY
jgi:hypothetical protein